MANKNIIQAKQEQVDALKARIEKSVAGVLVDYRGITVADDTKLRRELREAGVHYAVIKNNIMRRAATDSGFAALAESMTGTTAFALSEEDPIAAARDSSLALRLNIGFFLRQLGIFLVMDLLLLVLAIFGMSLYAENRCADVVGLVNQRGVPSEDALAWMEASDYTITPLDRAPEGSPERAASRWRRRCSACAISPTSSSSPMSRTCPCGTRSKPSSAACTAGRA